MNAAFPISIAPRRTITPLEIMTKYSIPGPETLAASRTKATRGVKMKSKRSSNKFCSPTKSSKSSTTVYDLDASTIHDVEEESNESTEMVEIDCEVYQDHHFDHHHVNECNFNLSIAPSDTTNDDDSRATKIQMEQDALNNNSIFTIANNFQDFQDPLPILPTDIQKDMDDGQDIGNVTPNIISTCDEDQQMACTIPEMSVPKTFSPPSEPSSNNPQRKKGNRKRPEKWANFFLGKPRKRRTPALKNCAILETTETPEENLAHVILRIEFQPGGLFYEQRQEVRDMIAKQYKIYKKDPNNEKQQEEKFLRLRFFRPEDRRARHYDYLDVFRLPPFEKFQNELQLFQAIDDQLLGESAGGSADFDGSTFESDGNMSNSVTSNTSSSSASSSDNSCNLRLNTVDPPLMTGVCDCSSNWDLIPISENFVPNCSM